MTSTNPYYIAPELLQQLENAKRKVVKGDQDRVFCIDGREGSGKSTLALQLAYQIDPSLTLDDVVFTADDFADRIRNTKKYKAIVFDEAFNGLSSKGALSKANKELVKLLMECRQLNLFIFIVLPSIFLLEKYVAIFRSHGLLHTFTSKADINRRYVKVYNYSNKKRLYLLGKQYLSYGRPRIFKNSRFYGKFPPSIDKEAYQAKKLNAFRDSQKEEKNENRKWLIQRNFMIQKLYQYTTLNAAEITRILKECEFTLEKSIITKICQDMPRISTNTKTSI